MRPTPLRKLHGSFCGNVRRVRPKIPLPETEYPLDARVAEADGFESCSAGSKDPLGISRPRYRLSDRREWRLPAARSLSASGTSLHARIRRSLTLAGSWLVGSRSN